MLWVYEGMTEYWGNVLAARSGLKNPQEYKDVLAMTAASWTTRGSRVEADGGYGRGRQHSARRKPGVDKLAARPGFLLRR